MPRFNVRLTIETVMVRDGEVEVEGTTKQEAEEKARAMAQLDPNNPRISKHVVGNRTDVAVNGSEPI